MEITLHFSFNELSITLFFNNLFLKITILLAEIEGIKDMVDLVSINDNNSLMTMVN